MTCHRLALIGFGNVGRALVRLLLDKTAQLRDEYGVEWRITGVASRRIGWIADPDGLDPQKLLALPATADSRAVGALLAAPPLLPSGPFQGAALSERSAVTATEAQLAAGAEQGAGAQAAPLRDVREWLRAARADALFEMSSLNRHTGEPATEHLRAALETGAHALSANKGPVVYAYEELRALAAKAGQRFLFESAVMDGTPVFNLFRETLPVVNLRGFHGLLNSTSNVVLMEMEAGRTFEEAVRRAQEIGVAETDPSDDLEGWDPAVKVAALVNVLMGVPFRPQQVERVGIVSLDPATVRDARASGRPYKLICRAQREGSSVRASVRPEQLFFTDPLAQMMGTTSCLHFDLDVFGLTVIEHKPGIVATAYGLLSDFLRAVHATADERK